MYLEAHWEMYKVKIQVIQLQISERLVQTDGDVLRSVVSTPQLGEEAQTMTGAADDSKINALTLTLQKQVMKTASPAWGPHLTDDEHVRSFDDTLGHLGFQGFANISFILITVSCVNVAIASRDGGLYRTLDFGVEKVGGL